MRKLPDKDNPLNLGNQVCNQIHKFMNAHSGFNRDEMQGYLDLFYFIHNTPMNKYEKLVKLMELGLANPKLLRFKD